MIEVMIKKKIMQYINPGNLIFFFNVIHCSAVENTTMLCALRTYFLSHCATIDRTTGWHD